RFGEMCYWLPLATGGRPDRSWRLTGTTTSAMITARARTPAETRYPLENPTVSAWSCMRACPPRSRQECTRPPHRGFLTRKAPGLLSRCCRLSFAAGADHTKCVTPAHPVRQEAREGAPRHQAH